MTGDDLGLGPTIRAWRDRLPPSEVGLPTSPRRRAAGLRREDLAELTGVSVDYVVRLEQGRATHPSVPVVAALARALQLTTAERDHLFRLARHAPPSDTEISDHVPPGVHRTVSRLQDVAVAVFAADWQMIWWNRGWAALLGDPAATPPALRNFARDTFPVDGASPRLSHWPVTSYGAGSSGLEPVDAAVVSDLRRASGRFPGSRRLAGLISELRAGNADFAERWAAGAVAAHREDHKVVAHPGVGPIEVNCDVLTDGDAELKIVILTSAPGSSSETRMRLAMLAGAADPVPAPH